MWIRDERNRRQNISRSDRNKTMEAFVWSNRYLRFQAEERCARSTSDLRYDKSRLVLIQKLIQFDIPMSRRTEVLNTPKWCSSLILSDNVGTLVHFALTSHFPQQERDDAIAQFFLFFFFYRTMCVHISLFVNYKCIKKINRVTMERKSRYNLFAIFQIKAVLGSGIGDVLRVR